MTGKPRYLPHYCPEKGVNSTIVNRTNVILNEWTLETKSTVPLSTSDYLDHLLPVPERIHGGLRQHNLAFFRIYIHLFWAKRVVLNQSVNQSTKDSQHYLAFFAIYIHLFMTKLVVLNQFINNQSTINQLLLINQLIRLRQHYLTFFWSSPKSINQSINQSIFSAQSCVLIYT